MRKKHYPLEKAAGDEGLHVHWRQRGGILEGIEGKKSR